MLRLAGLLLVAFVLGAVGQASAAQGPWVLPAANLSKAGQDADEPQIATGPDGTTTAIWQRSEGTNTIIQAATRTSGRDFGPTMDLSEPGQDAFGPQVSFGPDGTTTVVWARSEPTGSLIQARTRPPGGSFGPTVNLSAPGEAAFEPQVDTGADGTTTVVWRRFENTYIRIQAATRPPGGSFGSPTTLSAAGQLAWEPQVSVGPDGTGTAVWRLNGTVQVATKPPTGNFGSATDLSVPGSTATDPQVDTGPGGTSVVWQSSNGSGGWFIQLVARLDGGGFGQPVNLSAGSPETSSPQISIGPDGSNTVVWFRADGAKTIVQATSGTPAGGFGPVLDMSEPGQDAWDPQVSTGPDGTTAVVWTREGSSGDLTQVRSRPPGGIFGPVQQLSELGQGANNPQISTGPDAVTATWVRYDGSNYIVQMASTQRVMPSTPRPSASTAIFDGKYLYVRLKCAARFKPGCKGFAQAVTKKSKKGKAMSSRASAVQRAGKWKVLRLSVKPAFKAKIAAMGEQPTKKLLVVKSVIRAKKYMHNKKSVVFHLYKVNTYS